MKQVEEIAKLHDVPIACTGDIFEDGWREKKCPPELINFAIEHMPFMYAVAGNHDLPHHRVDEIEKSAYWTLIQSHTIRDLAGYQVVPQRPSGESLKAKDGRRVWLHGFAWGEEVKRDKIVNPQDMHVAVIHAYCWKDGHAFPGVKPEDHVGKWIERQYDQFDAMVFGDNHHAFIQGDVLNGGAFMRRRKDEADHKPFVGLLTAEGEWRKHYLDISKDQTLPYDDEGFHDTKDKANDFTDFIKELEKLGDSALDFAAVVREMCDAKKIDEATRRFVIQCMEGKR